MAGVNNIPFVNDGLLELTGMIASQDGFDDVVSRLVPSLGEKSAARGLIGCAMIHSIAR